LEREGFEVTYLNPTEAGIITPEAVAAAIRPDTTLVSLMHVNNEIGVINDIAAIGKVTRENKVIYHVDAAQSTGKIDIDMEAMQVDLMSLTAHKVYGPKGIGALYVRRKPRVRIEPQIHGGGHERGMRSGTLATHQIVGMGEAYHLAKEEMVDENARLLALRNRLLNGFNGMEEVFVNGDVDRRVAHNLNISFNFVEGESLMMALRDLAVSSGSACTSASLEPSYVLSAIGLNDEQAHSSLRISIGRFTTEEEVDYSLEKIRDAVGKLRESSPLWEVYKDGAELNQVKRQAH
jgi:cysteine desulfurase